MMSTNPEILVYPTIEEAQAATASQMADLLAESSRALVVLSGGSAPPGVFHQLCHDPLRSMVPWEALSILWADERLVPFYDRENNYFQTRQTLLDHVPIPSEQVFPVATYYPVEEAARIYQNQVEALLERHGGQIDVALLGMGPDGHTASLFPGFPQLGASPETLVAPVTDAPKPPPTRVTLTAHALNRARRVIFLVTGADKAPMVHQVLQGAYDPERLPAQLVRPPVGRVTWMLDAAAARELA
ncbi:MAG: 6-phosphogluconolactonase [Chloroflexia bacterium]|nr:6-phosphogluconolactonase [Chloroflexia bacterium]